VNSFQDYNISAEQIYMSKINGAYMTGSGLCIKIEDTPLNPRKPVETETALMFILSDGHYAVKCMAHNGLRARLFGMDDDKLQDTLRTLTDSLRNGSKISISGAYHMQGKEKVFVVENVVPYSNLSDTQLTKHQFREFLSCCRSAGISPIDLMMNDQTLWGELYAHEPIKLAVLLFCLSPNTKQDMLHIGIVTSMGEGKDHLIEKVIQPLVPCGMASSGKLCTIPGLFGAMSGDDLNSIELGLLPKMNNERVAVSEFQTWEGDVFGELMNTMANGFYTMQKGQLDIKRESKVNLMFLGNPPATWKEETDKNGKLNKMAMLKSFDPYTYQILSRLTLIFTQMSLTDDSAEVHIENTILDAMSGVFNQEEVKKRMSMWRSFFREYLRYVSRTEPEINGGRRLLQKTFGEIKSAQTFKDAFLARSSKDFRKFQEFVNLCRGMARLDGASRVEDEHIAKARKLFEISLKTLVSNFDLNQVIQGADYHLYKLHRELHSGSKKGWFKTWKEIHVAAPKLTKEQLEKMIGLGWVEYWDGDQSWQIREILDEPLIPKN
jgi:DNA replicative helicase MCM subunit Mcm2 (Cdc46/Mcm family)